MDILKDTDEFQQLETQREPLIEQTRAGNGSPVIDNQLDEIEQREFQIAEEAGIPCERMADLAQIRQWQEQYGQILERINSGRGSLDNRQALSLLEAKIANMGHKYGVAGHIPELIAHLSNSQLPVAVDG